MEVVVALEAAAQTINGLTRFPDPEPDCVYCFPQRTHLQSSSKSDSAHNGILHLIHRKKMESVESDDRTSLFYLFKSFIILNKFKKSGSYIL